MSIKLWAWLQFICLSVVGSPAGGAALTFWSLLTIGAAHTSRYEANFIASSDIQLELNLHGRRLFFATTSQTRPLKQTSYIAYELRTCHFRQILFQCCGRGCVRTWISAREWKNSESRLTLAMDSMTQKTWFSVMIHSVTQMTWKPNLFVEWLVTKY